ncbi:GAF domain-containing protein [Synechococcus elongatus]|uniref:GAF domain-containing protein n=1 Tax=Synechococcus elongatus PCC 11801 TaxID=2219813 RepID=A0AAQ3MCS0_SYNEL
MSTTQRPENAAPQVGNSTAEHFNQGVIGADLGTPSANGQNSSSTGSKPVRSGLKLKLTLLAIAMGVLPVLGVGMITHSLVNRSITEMAQTSGSATAQQEAEQLKRSLFFTLLWGTGLSALAVGVIAAALASRSSQRLQAVIDALEKLSQGDLNVAVAADGDDEIAVLGQEVNQAATQIQTVLATAEVSREQQRSVTVRVNQLVREITLRLISQSSVADVLNAAVQEARIALGCDRVILYKFDETWAGTVVAESVDPGWPPALHITIDDPCFRKDWIDAYTAGRVQATADIYNAGLTECHLRQLAPLAVRANLVTPVIVEKQLIGLFIAHQCSGPRQWQQFEIDLLTQLATQVGLAMTRALFLEQQVIEANRAKLVRAITSELVVQEDVESVLRTAVQETRRAINADRVVIYEFDKNWSGTIIAESVDSNWPSSLNIVIDDPCFRRDWVEAYAAGRIQATPDIYNAGLTECHLKQLEPLAVKANLVAPIVIEKKLISLFIAHQCSGPRDWQQSEIDLFGQLATQVGLAITRARFLEQQIAETNRAKLVRAITSDLVAQSDVESVLRVAVQETRRALATDRVIVYEFDENWSGTIIAESVDSTWPSSLNIVIDDPCFRRDWVEAYAAGRIQATPDIYNAGLTECHLKQLEPLAVRANLVAPIVIEKKLIALFIAHQCSGTRDWEQSEVDLFGQLATQVGLAITRARFLEQQIAETNRAKLVRAITSDLVAQSDVESVLRVAVQETRRALATDRVIVYEFDENWSGTIIAESVDSTWPSSLNIVIDDPCFRRDWVEAYAAGRIQATPDIYNAGLTECHLKQLEPLAVRANLVAPIVIEKKLIALFIAHQCSGTRTWEQSEIDLFSQLATQLGLAITRARFLEQQVAEANRAKIVRDITSQLVSPTTVDSVLQLAVHATRRALATDRVVVYEFDASWSGTVIAESVNSAWPSALNVTIDDPCFRRDWVEAYAAGRIQATPDIYNAGLTECHLKQLEPLAVRANLVAPIVVEKRLIALFVAHHCAGPRNWQQSEIDLFSQLATQLGLAITRARFLEQQVAEANRAEQIREITSRLLAQASPEDVLQIAVKETRRALSTNRVVVYEFDEAWSGTVVAESVDYEWPSALHVTIDDPCFRRDWVDAYAAGRVQATPDIYNAGLTECHLKQLEPLAVRANLVAPIVVEKKLIALFVAHQCSGPRNWQQSEIDLFTQLATQVGLALARADFLRQAEESRDRAEQLAQEQRQRTEAIQTELIRLLSDVEEASRGDLTVRADISAGEISTVADIFNSLIESLRAVVVQVKASTQKVNASLDSDANSMQRLAADSQSQAEKIKQTLNAVAEMSNSIVAVSNTANQAAEVARKSSETAISSGQTMDETVRSILHLRETVAETAKKVKRLGESSQQISKVISLINQIALQTNLLAINASIEAARAGEEGRGFAVVAEEVGELATRSAAATKEIEQIVEAIQQETNEVVTAMETGTSQVVEGTQLVETAKKNLEEIVFVSQQIDQLVQAISQATVSQSQTSNIVTDLMKEMADFSEEISDTSRHISTSLQSTVAVAQKLKSSVDTFRVGAEE